MRPGYCDDNDNNSNNHCAGRLSAAHIDKIDGGYYIELPVANDGIRVRIAENTDPQCNAVIESSSSVVESSNSVVESSNSVEVCGCSSYCTDCSTITTGSGTYNSGYKCIFFTSATQMKLDKGVTINGATVNTDPNQCQSDRPCSTYFTNTLGITTVNGGYYLNVPSGKMAEISVSGSVPSVCSGGGTSSAVVESSSSSAVVNSSSSVGAMQIVDNQFPQQISVPSGTCLSLSGSWTNNGYQAPIHIECQKDGNIEGLRVVYGNNVWTGVHNLREDTGVKTYYTTTPVVFISNVCVYSTGGAATVKCALRS